MNTTLNAALTAELSQHLTGLTHPKILVILGDELNITAFQERFSLPPNTYCDILTNRYPEPHAAPVGTTHVHFNDFDYSSLTHPHYDLIYIPVSKEKSVCLHNLNSALKRLKKDGKLLLSGTKNTGIKSYFKNHQKAHNLNGNLKKYGDNYIATLKYKEILKYKDIQAPQTLSPQTPSPKTVSPQTLPPHESQSPSVPHESQSPSLPHKTKDETYGTMEVIGEINDQPIYSKAGVFGWNKIDSGSQLLIDELQTRIQNKGHHDNQSQTRPSSSLQYLKLLMQLDTISALDLGCGYGYLSIALAQLGCQDITATDNNAAAVLCCEKNLSAFPNITAQVQAAHCGHNIDRTFDLVICNPPFHKGFSIDANLTQQFLCAAANKLNTHGTAFFVVNAFIGIEKLAKDYFKHVEVLKNNTQFKVIALHQPLKHKK